MFVPASRASTSLIRPATGYPVRARPLFFKRLGALSSFSFGLTEGQAERCVGVVDPAERASLGRE